jgi:hypothetical protein
MSNQVNAQNDNSAIVLTIENGMITDAVSNTPVTIYVIDKDFTTKKNDLLEAALAEPIESTYMLFDSTAPHIKAIIEGQLK